MLLPGLYDRSVSPRHTTIHDPENFEPSSRAALRRALGEAGYEEYRSILSDPDAELRAEALLHLARRQELSGNLAVASELYQGLENAGEETPAAVAARARTQRNAILGVGDGGRRAEFLLRRLALEACDPAGIAGMVLAGGVFRVTRLAALGRLAATPSLGMISRGFLARAAASTAAFALEAPAFTLGSRATHQILGREVDWSGHALARDFASSYLVLGGLKVAGWAGGAAYRATAGSVGAVRERPLQLLFQQGGMFGGILFGHWLEAEAGLRPRQAGATTLVDSLAMLAQFNVAGRLASRGLGEGFHARERALDLQTEGLGRALPPVRPLAPRLALQPALAGIGAEAAPPSAVHDLIRGVQILQMSIFKDNKGPRGPEPTSARESGVMRSAEPRVSQEAMTEEVDYFLRGVENPELGLRAFLDSLPIAAAVARIKGEDGFGRIFVVNQKFTDLFGYSERQAGGHPITHFFSLKSAPFIAARIWTILRGGVFQATKMDFLCRDGSYRQIWGSGVVRNVYGETLAFGFYQPRDESQATQPQVLAPLKIFQAADPSRLPSLDAQGFFELRSTIELSLQLTNPDSPLIRHFMEKDLNVRVSVPDNYATQTYADSLTRGLNLLTRRIQIPVGRRFSVELVDSTGQRHSFLQWLKRPEGFVTAEISSPAGGVMPTAPRAPRPGIFAEVTRALSNIRPGTEERPSNPPNTDPGKKGSDRR
ncbi:MAG: PAS domain-containing protein [Deltaproteobacteria bacterium]|nr:PAS domain-containing protein [Deltaproteobacteria bacterium]